MSEYGSHIVEEKQLAVRFAQCLRGHPVLIMLLPVTWRFASNGFWHDENGRRVDRADVLERLENRICDLYGFFPTREELKYIHDDLLVPLYSEDALSRFLHTFLYPDPKANVQLDALWHRWSCWQHRTVEPQAAWQKRMRLRKLRLVDDALLGWEWKKQPNVRKPGKVLDIAVPEGTPLTEKQKLMRRWYEEAMRLGIAVPGNMKKSYANLLAHRAAANATPPSADGGAAGTASTGKKARANN